MSLQPYEFPPLPSPQVIAVREYLKFFSEYNIEGLRKVTTDDFTASTLPASLGVATKTRDEEFAVVKQLQTSFEGKPLQITVYDVDDGYGKTWVHSKIEELELENVYLFQFGVGLLAHKIVSVKEFVDSKRYGEIN